ncbi:hypothetical protein GCM10010492_54530 [Saccharothrix mutabilis subsp. mutabilis]|uniref:ABC-2 type transport system permease protein n=1 Tax=Saccharothrix mutabilis subsp. mutabilis TaxID=66855 RepID=A0ABP3E2P3_9PSEU
MTELVAKSVRDNRGSTLGWGAVLVASVALQLAVFPSVHRAGGDIQQLLDSYPEAFKALFGVEEAFTSGVGFLKAEAFGFLAPLVLLGVAIGQAAKATAAEEHAGTLDLLLANPISRAGLLARKALAVVVNVAVVTAALALVLVVGGAAVDLGVPVGSLLWACVAVALLALPFGASALLVGAATGRPGAAVAVPVGVAVLTFLVEALSPLASALEPWRVLSPFRHAAVGDALAGRPDWAGFAVLLVLTGVLVTAAIAVFQRHDIKS